MVRRDYLPTKLPTLVAADGNYNGSQQQIAVNNWFAATNPSTGLAANAPLRSVIVGNTAMANLGTDINLTTGYSAPTGSTGATGANTAFALSFSEAYTFMGTGRTSSIAPVNSSFNDNPMGTINYQFITENLPATVAYEDLPYIMLRTYGISGYPFSWINYRGSNASMYGWVCLNIVSQANMSFPTVAPAVWIDTAAAQAAGLFSNR